MIPKRPTPQQAVQHSLPPPPPSQIGQPIKFATIQQRKGHRVVLYGTGGIGKTTLACLAAGKSAFVDADESLSVLAGQLKALEVEAPAIVPANDYKSLRSALRSPGWNGIQNVVLDTITKIEEWCVEHTLKTIKTERDRQAEGIEDYGYGKGYQYVFETFLNLLAELDAHVRAGRNVFLIAHDCASNVPNPDGADWIRYEPRLQHPASGKASIRYRLKEWADHVLFLGYDVDVTKEKGQRSAKAKGVGTRTLYTAELPWFMAKSRTTTESFSIQHGEFDWSAIIK